MSMNYSAVIYVIICLASFFCNHTQAQTNTERSVQCSLALPSSYQKLSYLTVPGFRYLPSRDPLSSGSLATPLTKDVGRPTGYSIGPRRMPFFCRIEEEYVKSNNLNLRFRLGSVDYVDYLEQKPNASLLPGQ